MNKALSTMLQTDLNISGSGRTDTGVHCKQQFFHVDFESVLTEEDLRYKANAILPFDISINSVRKVKNESHARFDAISRSYEYHINTVKDPFARDLSYYFSNKLNIENMNAAAALLLGEKRDYESFSRVKTEVNNFECSISKAYWESTGDKLVFHITSNRFLRGMVRAIVGTLLDVGLGRRSIEDLNTILLNKNRRDAGRAAPAHGLYLTQVIYPENIYL